MSLLKNSLFLYGGALLILVLIGIAGFLLSKEAAEYQTVTVTEVGLQLEYRMSPDGYVFTDVEVPGAIDPTFVKHYSLMLQSDAASLASSTGPREAPPTIDMVIFRNPNNQTLAEWVEGNPLLSNATLRVGEVESTTIDGREALLYTVDGLYRSRVLVTMNREFIILFVGSYLEMGSLIQKDFEELLHSVRLSS